ncbi:uncharacterized protein LOC122311704 [Carya illinoinensis]|uniref:Uncharacterized protein n=1 Tax=Carya illinoinensis TaxID=32201 RepID=A0A8T1QDC7_CARIL|nr:uncharacterized protein LOC122311704 [Carya illinoinensis]KAG6652528.1 hypothetical protein CIPAW_05G012800 [Carya illinoinensis]
MASHHIPLLSSFLLILAAIQGIRAVNYAATNTASNTSDGVHYTVTNTARNTSGAIRFDNHIGFEYSLQALASTTYFIWKLFQQTNDADKKNVSKVSLFIDDMDGVAYTSNNEIHVSAKYINGHTGNLKGEITGVFYHEMTHIWQWNGNGEAPGGLIEGIADFVRLKSGYIPSHWVQPGQGDRWDQGYDVTARFLDYCNDLRNGFVADLNKKMINGYNVNYFVNLLDKSVDQLWSDYKALYHKKASIYVCGCMCTRIFL